MSDDFEEELIKTRMFERMIKAAKRLQAFPDKVVEISDVEFESFIKKYNRAVVDCWAEWCQPCRRIAPVIEELAREYREKIAFGKLNVDENRFTAMKYGVMSIPTILIFKDGELVDRVVGAAPKPLLEFRIKKALEL